MIATIVHTFFTKVLFRNKNLSQIDKVFDWNKYYPGPLSTLTLQVC